MCVATLDKEDNQEDKGVGVMAKRELISKNSIISLYKYFSKRERVFAGQVIVDVKAIPPNHRAGDSKTLS